MKEIEKSLIAEINKLHGEILNSLKMSLDKAIRIGELLEKQKENLKHGEFTAWVNNNLPFTDRTARNYMRVYQERDRLKTETVSDLTEAYELLTERRVLIEHVHNREVNQEKCFMNRVISLLTAAKTYEMDDEEIGNMNATALKKVKDWGEMIEQAGDLMTESKPSFLEEIKNAKELEKIVEWIDLAERCELQFRDVKLYARTMYRKCQIELKTLGVPESLLTGEGLRILREQYEAEIVRLS